MPLMVRARFLDPVGFAIFANRDGVALLRRINKLRGMPTGYRVRGRNLDPVFINRQFEIRAVKHHRNLVWRTDRWRE